jgi:hypothetical protein
MKWIVAGVIVLALAVLLVCSVLVLNMVEPE